MSVAALVAEDLKVPAEAYTETAARPWAAASEDSSALAMSDTLRLVALSILAVAEAPH